MRVPYDANNPLHSEAYGRKLGEEGEEFSVEAQMIEYEASNDKVLVVTDDSGIKKVIKSYRILETILTS